MRSMRGMFLRSALFAGFLVILPPAVDAQGAGFSDVYSTSSSIEAIQYLKDKQVLSGFADGSFRPDSPVNRAQVAVVLSRLLTPVEEVERCLREMGAVYSDVLRSDWYASAVCAGNARGWFEVDEEKTFRPADPVLLSEMALLLARVFDLPMTEGGEWFTPAIIALGDKHALPADAEATGQRVSRAQLAEMLWRLHANVEGKPSADIDSLLAAQCIWEDPFPVKNVDMHEVRRQWMQWLNGLRTSKGLQPLQQNRFLISSAEAWSRNASAIGSISHKRQAQTVYYDYKGIEQWFQNEHDITFASVNSITYTENIGWGVYKCSAEDCTQMMIDAVRTTFDMYLREQASNGVHYRSMVNPQYALAGVGVVVNEDTGRYYLTAHYATSITSDPDPICP